MRVHHLNCGTCCPAGGRLFDGTSDGLLARLVCHCLLLELGGRLVLIDTGYGSQEVETPERRISPFFRALNNPQLRREETAIAQVRALGLDPLDVRDIVITHLDVDHAGGIEDFPHARIHVTAREKEVADARAGGAGVRSQRYRPQQWDSVLNWQLYPMGTEERWRGFDCVRDLTGLPPEILLVPLPGHTWGHSGVTIDTGSGWLFYAGDAYFYRGEMSREAVCPPGLRGYQRLMEVDRAARLTNQKRLHELVRSERDISVFCAHDAVEFELLSGARSG